jgi:hypothetical protein
MPAKRKKTKTKKTIKAPAKKAKAKKAAKKSPVNYNQAALWQTYKELQAKADKAWEKFRTDVRKKAKDDVLVKDRNELLLLLGECDYMVRECMRCSNQAKK